MKKVIIVDPGPIGQALKSVLELKGGMEVLIVKNEDELVDALGTFPAEAMVVAALNDKRLQSFACDNARPGQKVVQLGWDKEPEVPRSDPQYVRLPIMGEAIVKFLLEI